MIGRDTLVSFCSRRCFTLKEIVYLMNVIPFDPSIYICLTPQTKTLLKSLSAHIKPACISASTFAIPTQICANAQFNPAKFAIPPALLIRTRTGELAQWCERVGASITGTPRRFDGKNYPRPWGLGQSLYVWLEDCACQPCWCGW